MKAIDFLKELLKVYPNVVAITRNKNKEVLIHINDPERQYWGFLDHTRYKIFRFPEIIEWDSENHKNNVVCINDFKN